MMAKKRLIVLICLAITVAAVLGGCGDSSPASGSTGSVAQSSDHSEKNGGVEDVLEAGMQEEDGKAAGGQTPGASQDSEKAAGGETPGASQDSEEAAGGETPGASQDSEEAAGGVDVDVDLTVLSATMVYSEVFNMMKNPDDYIGKSIRMRGDFSYFKDESTGKEYFACIIRDATACCAQGIEFELVGNYVYPDDYPELGEEITVRGVFDVYKEGDSKYCTLRNAVKE